MMPAAGALRPLLAPLALTLLGFALHAGAARLPWLNHGAAGPALRQLGGVLFWLALAWALGRLADLLLLRAAAVARRSAPYPRLLGDGIRALLFIVALIAILGFVFEQSAFGLITASSVALAVLGFALRGILADIFAGLALSVDHPYRIGDWIEAAEGAAGRVTEINWRATRLVTRDGVTLELPNGLIAAHRLANFGPNGLGRYRVALRVALDPALPPERARRILLAGALDAGRSIQDLAPDVILQEISEGAAHWLVRFHVPDYGREAACRDAVAGAVLRALQHIGQEVARPQREVRHRRVAPPPPRPRRRALLRRIPLFRGFSDEERAALEQAMEERVLARGASIVRAGEPGHSLFILAEGVLDVRVAQEGVERVVDRMVPGDVFGEMSLLTGQARSATVLAATEAVVFEIDKEHLDPLLHRRPALAEGLAAIMAGRQAHNAALARLAPPPAPEPEPPEHLLARLRAFFGLERGTEGRGPG